MTEFRQKLLDYGKTLENKEQVYGVYTDGRAGYCGVYEDAMRLKITCNNKAEAIVALVDWLIENRNKRVYGYNHKDEELTFNEYIKCHNCEEYENIKKIVDHYFDWQSEVNIYLEEPINIRFNNEQVCSA